MTGRGNAALVGDRMRGNPEIDLDDSAEPNTRRLGECAEHRLGGLPRGYDIHGGCRSQRRDNVRIRERLAYEAAGVCTIERGAHDGCQIASKV